MIETRRLLLLRSSGCDPYRNLAIEEELLNRVQPGECIFYLWQNRRTVVIGRNQNAASECHIAALEADGGHLARRLSGGGAVYHDIGNLNFTFLVPTAQYDLSRQTEVILRAVQRVGIKGERTGRNDLTVGGAKFSGHAYYHTGAKSYHHGTIMVDVDGDLLAKYLTVSPLKLGSKGVDSVRSRVTNLAQHRPGLTIAELETALAAEFSTVYGLPVENLSENSLDEAAIAAGRARFSAPQWIYGDCRALANSREARFAWGTVRLDFSLMGEKITEAALWSDGLDADALEQIPALLCGCALTRADILKRIGKSKAGAAAAKDIASLLVAGGEGE